jgi:polysaccharide biosynthesis protein PslJ
VAVQDAPAIVAPVPRRAYVAAALLALLILAAALVNAQPTYVVVGVTGLLVAWATYRYMTQWHVMVGAIILIILLVPIGRYGLPITLPFQLEPYRALVAIVAVAWFASLAAEPEMIRLRPSGLLTPVLFLALVIAASVVANLETIHARGIGTSVIFKISFFASYLIVMLLIGSALRTREELDKVLKVLIGGGAFVAFWAIVENKTGFNVFNHVHTVMPLFRFDTAGLPPFLEARGSGFRVYASAEHPIALGALLVMLLPTGIYVAWRSRRWWWWGAVALIGLAAVATVARTAILMLGTEALFLVAIKPRVVKRVWWLILPFVVAVNIAVPATIGTIKSSFFPAGGLVAQQDTNAGGDSSNRVSDIEPSLREARSTPWVGQGWGSRVPQQLDAAKTRRILDDQWLTLLLEVGALGVFGWLWFFLRNIRLLTSAALRDQTEHGWLLAGLAASILAFAVGMATFDAFGFPQVTLIMFILAGIGIAARRLGPITDAER